MTDKPNQLGQAQKFLKMMKRDNAHLEWLAQTHHPVFEVHHNDNHYTLHLYPLAADETDALHARHMIQQKVQANGLCVPEPVQTISNDTQTAALYTYINGQNQSVDALTAEEVQRIGHNLARLHQMPLQVKPRPRLDVPGLFGEDGVYALNEDTMTYLKPAQQELMQKVIHRIQETTQSLDADGDDFGLIHADLLLQNVLFQEDRLCLLDWEYCGYGYYLYDLTPLLWQLKTSSRYQVFKDALWQGYNTVRPLPQEHQQTLEILIGARHVASIRWVIQNRHLPAYRDRLRGIVASRMGELNYFLQTDTLHRT
jgi:Ser/Thr protein kinase RdoA (MazF antagonist)